MEHSLAPRAMVELRLVRFMRYLFLVAIVGLTCATSTHAGDISARAARHLASAYMLRYVSGCGGVEESIPRGSMWEVPVRFGFAGTPRGAIHVDRATGLLSYSYGSQRYPTVTPKQLADEIYRLTHRQ